MSKVMNRHIESHECFTCLSGNDCDSVRIVGP
jgi:hypothetical protein